ncbi:hypothetical protein SARC_05097 [Sphaeroforma arctica JP610]|uniref:Glutathione S-transferase n=1 Tax=Sphaeroforma arctica JP610 TaxID=667725 RepID=A0A0L0G377_9EUKA|nr:hypothetical protein SARC_05097 [Sphaeroforma arctica JP610]KNC82623.1 hypothetical protein SARC_05097 [Sphaeroforma arctica JP610]|eukprot:XP_014156525.1 hypothetical protein SARC_05097 [Sphaeroforma arctica JP610]
MPKLYYSTLSCGGANYIAAHVGGVKFDENVLVNIQTHKLAATGEDYFEINPKGNVPVITFEDGKKNLNENVGTLYYIGKNGGLLGEDETATMNALGFLASEWHKGVGAFFGKPEGAAREKAVANLAKQANFFIDFYLEGGKNEYMVGNTFTIADIYASVITSWSYFIGLNTEIPEALIKHHERIQALPKVAEAVKIMKDYEASVAK